MSSHKTRRQKNKAQDPSDLIRDLQEGQEVLDRYDDESELSKRNKGRLASSTVSQHIRSNMPPARASTNQRSVTFATHDTIATDQTTESSITGTTNEDSLGDRLADDFAARMMLRHVDNTTTQPHEVSEQEMDVAATPLGLENGALHTLLSQIQAAIIENREYDALGSLHALEVKLASRMQVKLRMCEKAGLNIIQDAERYMHEAERFRRIAEEGGSELNSGYDDEGSTRPSFRSRSESSAEPEPPGYLQGILSRLFGKDG